MSPVRQSLFFFSRYGFSITIVFLLASLVSTTATYILMGQVNEEQMLTSGGLELLVSSLIEPLATGTAICFILSRDKGLSSRLIENFTQARNLYLPLVSSYMIVLLMTLVGMGLYILPGLYMLYKLMFVEYRVVINGEQPLDALKGSFLQTKSKMKLLLPAFSLLLILVFGVQTIFSLLIQGNDLISQLVKSALYAPIQAFAVIVGFRLFSLTSDSG